MFQLQKNLSKKKRKQDTIQDNIDGTKVHNYQNLSDNYKQLISFLKKDLEIQQKSSNESSEESSYTESETDTQDSFSDDQ